jgi:hypothetical protein
MIEAFSYSFFNLLIDNGTLNFTDNLIINFILAVFLFLVPITLLHEALHGISYLLFGGKVKFGLKGMNVYCQEISGIKLHRTKFLVVLLTPITIISLISLLLPESLRIVVITLNLIGCTGDLLMSLYLIKHDNNSYILDKNYGFDIIK